MRKQNGGNKGPNQQKDALESCHNCGLFRHEPHKCSANGKVCLKCGKDGHFSRVCQFHKPLNDNLYLGETSSYDRPLAKSKSANTKKIALSKASYFDQNHEAREENNRNELAGEEAIDETNFRVRKDRKIQTSANTSLVNNLEQQKEGANAFYREKKFDLALFHYTRLIALYPNAESLYGNRAACLMMMDKYEDALIDARKSIEVNPAFTKGYTRLIKIAMAMGNFIEVEYALSKWTQNDPTNESLKIEQASFSDLREFVRNADENFASKNYTKALEDWDKVVKICTHCISFKIKKCEYLTLLGRYKDAAVIANGMLGNDKLNIDAKYILGVCLYHSDSDKALVYLKEILRLAPDHTKALELYKKTKSFIDKKSQGNEAFRQKNYENAHKFYVGALEIDPNNKGMLMKLYYNMAQASYQMKELEKSIEECTKALELDQNYVKALIRRGKCYLDMKEFEEAIDDLSRACQLDSGNDCQKLLQEAKALLKEAESDYYAILGVSRRFSAEELKRAYYEKAMQYHPDRHPNASEADKKKNERIFKNITRAYRTLKTKISADAGYNDEENDNEEMTDDGVPLWFMFFIHHYSGQHQRTWNPSGRRERRDRQKRFRGRGTSFARSRR